jgi:hypothetical protein
VSDSRRLPRSLTEYVLVWCEDLLQDLLATARTDLACTLSTMNERGPWPTRLRIQHLAEELSGYCGDANAFVGHGLDRKTAKSPGRPPGSSLLSSVRGFDRAPRQVRRHPLDRRQIRGVFKLRFLREEVEGH